MFKQIVENTEEIAHAYQPGLRALGSHSNRIKPANSSLCEGSVYLEKSLRSQYPHANLWDYVFGYNCMIHFVEVHPAAPKEAKCVIKKKEWLITWLTDKAPELKKEPRSFHWIPSGRNTILPDSREARLLAQQRIKLLWMAGIQEKEVISKPNFIRCRLQKQHENRIIGLFK